MDKLKDQVEQLIKKKIPQEDWKFVKSHSMKKLKSAEEREGRKYPELYMVLLAANVYQEEMYSRQAMTECGVT